MLDIKPNKSQMKCTIAMAIIVLGYAIERILSITLTLDKTMSLILAMVYTILLAVVFALVSSSKDCIGALLASLIGYKMMPPEIGELTQTTIDGAMLYFIVRKVAVVMFVLLVLKAYELQEKPRMIKPVPILAIMVAVPFCTSVGDKIGKYLLIVTGSMLGCYFAQFVAYAIATFAILGIAYRNNYESMAFAAVFEYVALAINILRRATVVIFLLANGQHVSKSYYVWIALYAGLIVVSAFMKNQKKKAIKE